MTPFQPFQQLFQYLKKDNPKLYLALESISTALQTLNTQLTTLYTNFNNIKIPTAYYGPTTLTDETASRAFTTTYTNGNSVALYVWVTVTLTAGGGNSVFSQVGPTTPSIAVSDFANPSITATMTVTVFFVVPPGFKYNVVNATSITKWIEGK